MANATFYPNVLYEDAPTAVEWLEGTLGFERGEVHEDGDGNVVHAEVRLGEAVVMVGSAGVGREPFNTIKPGNYLVYCAIDDVDGLHDRARDAGADIAVEITDTDYGSRDFTARDPEGNLWAFGTYRP
jgi:uncharacterized glyoxalase superfamily protein PhnB